MAKYTETPVQYRPSKEGRAALVALKRQTKDSFNVLIEDSIVERAKAAGLVSAASEKEEEGK